MDASHIMYGRTFCSGSGTGELSGVGRHMTGETQLPKTVYANEFYAFASRCMARWAALAIRTVICRDHPDGPRAIDRAARLFHTPSRP